MKSNILVVTTAKHLHVDLVAKVQNITKSELKQRQTLIKQNKNTDIYHMTITGQQMHNKTINTR